MKAMIVVQVGNGFAVTPIELAESSLDEETMVAQSIEYRVGSRHTVSEILTDFFNKDDSQ